jgi:hypothetical protein
MGAQPDRQGVVYVVVVAVMIAALAPATAGAYEPQPPGYLEGALTNPPGLPPAPAQPGTSSPTRARLELGPASDHRKEHGCGRPTSSTLLETSKVRVYAMPEDSVKLPGGRDQTISGRPVFGFLRTTGKSRLLDLPAEKYAFWVSVDPAAIAVSAPLVAYPFTQYYTDTHETWVRVRNLRTGAVVRSCPAGGGMAPHVGSHPIKIVLNSRGAVAFSVEGTRGSAIVACDSLEPQTLDEGGGVEPESLSLAHGVVSWVDEGGEIEAALE